MSSGPEIVVDRKYVQGLTGESESWFSPPFFAGFKPDVPQSVNLAARLFSQSTFRSCIDFNELKIPITWSPDPFIAKGGRVCASGKTTGSLISIDDGVQMQGVSTLDRLIRFNQITSSPTGRLTIGTGHWAPFLLPQDITGLVMKSFAAPLFPNRRIEPVPIPRFAGLELPTKGTPGPFAQMLEAVRLVTFDATICNTSDDCNDPASVHFYFDFPSARRFFTTGDFDLSWIRANSSIDWPAFPLSLLPVPDGVSLEGTTDLRIRKRPETGSVEATLKGLDLRSRLLEWLGPEPATFRGDLRAVVDQAGKIALTIDHLSVQIPNFPSARRTLGSFSGTVTGELNFYIDSVTGMPVFEKVDVTIEDLRFGTEGFKLNGDLILRYRPADPTRPRLEDLDFSYNGDVVGKIGETDFALNKIDVGLDWDLEGEGSFWANADLLVGLDSPSPGPSLRAKIKAKGDGEQWSASLKTSSFLKGGQLFVSVKGSRSKGFSNGNYQISLPSIDATPFLKVSKLSAEGQFALPSLWKLIANPSVVLSGTVRGKVGQLVEADATLTHRGTVGWDKKLKSIVATLDPEESKIEVGPAVVTYGGGSIPFAGALAPFGGEIAFTPLQKGGLWVSGNKVGVTGGRIFVDRDGKKVPLLTNLTLFADQLHGIRKGVVTGRGMDLGGTVDLCLLGLNGAAEGCSMKVGQYGMNRIPLNESAHWRLISEYLKKFYKWGNRS